MQTSQFEDQLRKDYLFTKKSLYVQALTRPNISLKLILARLKYRLFKKTTICKATLFFNSEMYVQLPEEISEVLFLHRFFEYDLTSMLLQTVKPEMHFVDIGAHYGFFSLLASELVGSLGKVTSFEPTPDSFDILALNTSMIRNIKINNLAVLDETKEIEFSDFGKTMSAYNSFTKIRIPDYKGPAKKIKMKAVTVDDAFKDEIPDIIKIDAEFKILHGMKKTIQEHHPMIIIEVGDSVKGVPTSKSCVEYLLNENYVPFESKNSKITPHNLKETYKQDNILFKFNR